VSGALIRRRGSAFASTPYTIETPRFLRTFDNGLDTVTGVTFQPDGLTMYLTNQSGTDSAVIGVYEYDLSTAWDISTAVASGSSHLVGANIASIGSAQFLDSGTNIFVISNNGNDFFGYTFSTAYDLSTASLPDLGIPTGDNNTNGLHIVEKTTSDIYITGATDDVIRQFSMTTKDVDLLTFVRSLSVATQDAAPRGVVMDPTQTTMLVSGNQNDSVYQYTLSTAGDISTASYDSVLLNTGTDGETGPYDICFGDGGKYLYVTGFSNGLTQYAL
tara:strand:+ start:1773 stop:2594 length:822 start_codon:yes stop_codon:yes gene_type:complete